MKTSMKCSVLLAAGAGASVCLTGGGAFAAKITGAISASNAGRTVFAASNSLKLFNAKVNGMFLPESTHDNRIWFWGGAINLNGTALNSNAYIAMHSAGVAISNGMAHSFVAKKVPANVSDRYMAIRFADSGDRFGWVHVHSTNAGRTQIVLDTWGYEDSGASIHTLGESVTAKKLGLSDGRAKLMWSNANEDGIARYEAQTKDASGAWTAVSSDAAGAGHYSATVPAGATCRIVVEKVDGATEEIGF